MRALVWAGLGLVLVAGGAAGAGFAFRACGPLDRSGCVAAFTVPDMTGLGDTITPAPGAEGRLWVAGHRHVPRSSGQADNYEPHIELALVNTASGRQVSRFSAPHTGVPFQLVVSANGERVAIANSGLYVRSADLIVLDAEGETLWTYATDGDGIVPDAEGEMFALAFGPGGEVYADPIAFDAEGNQIGGQPVERSRVEAATTGIALPDGFVPWTFATIAHSSDGAREAVLLRRFYGPDEGVQAILEIRDATTGATIVRHEIEDPLNAALSWDPLGRGVIVARAGALEPGTDTQLRIYSAEARP